jgi:hypothetical protein
VSRVFFSDALAGSCFSESVSATLMLAKPGNIETKGHTFKPPVHRIFWTNWENIVNILAVLLLQDCLIHRIQVISAFQAEPEFSLINYYWRIICLQLKLLHRLLSLSLRLMMTPKNHWVLKNPANR